MSTEFPWPTIRYQSWFDERVLDRQNQLPAFDSRALARMRVLVVGAGGLGGHLAVGLARKGVGTIHVADDDIVEPTNLNRQVFYMEDLFQPKAFALAKNVACEGHMGTTCVGHYVAFDDESAAILGQQCDVALVGVDNDQTRILAARHFREKKLPVLFCAVNERADQGWAFVQAAAGPCLACAFPNIVRAAGQPRPCAPSPATLDILLAVIAPLLYAVDSLVMPRQRHWNLHWRNLVGDSPDYSVMVPARPGCLLCEHRQDQENVA